MSKYIFTHKGYEKLKEVIVATEKKLQEVTKAKAEAGAGQDTWHDEGFKLGVAEEMMWNKRLRELYEVSLNAQIVEPEEQNEVAKIGTGVIVEYEDGKIGKYILEGYLVGKLEGRVSIYSPLGKSLLKAKEGERKSIKIGDTEKTFTIQKILLPSIAETIFQTDNSKQKNKEDTQ